MEKAEIESLTERLLEESFPRLQMILIISLAGLGAFLSSVALLHSGVGSMAARYSFAAAVGYLLFLALVRAWLAYQRNRWSPDLDVPIDESADGVADQPFFSGEGGSFGGGGASGSFDSPAEPGGWSGPDVESSVLDVFPDLDEAWPVALGLAALFAGIVALGFIVYASPVLFAEVLLNAAVAGAVYRRARRRSRSHWLHGVIRRTWLPAAALCVFFALAGFVLQRSAPEAQSLGAVLRSGSSE